MYILIGWGMKLEATEGKSPFLQGYIFQHHFSEQMQFLPAHLSLVLGYVMN